MECGSGTNIARQIKETRNRKYNYDAKGGELREEQGSQNAVMGHREKNRDMHNEDGMPLWDMGG